jgi:hypothetical protein
MRQIYTSPRVENVERIVAMMREAGIETSVTNRRAYAGHDYRRPSYALPPDRDEWPTVWIVKAEDQPRARALLREIGIEPATRFADELAQARQPETGPEAEAARRKELIWRVRFGLIIVIAALILLNAFGIRIF